MDETGPAAAMRRSTCADARQAFVAQVRLWVTNPRAWIVILAYAAALAVAAWPLHGEAFANQRTYDPGFAPALRVIWLEMLLVFLIGAAMTTTLLRPGETEVAATMRPSVAALAKVVAAVFAIWLLIAATGLALAAFAPMGRRPSVLAAIQMVVAVAGLFVVFWGAFWSTVFSRRPWLAALATSSTVALLAGARVSFLGSHAFGGFWGWTWLPIGENDWAGSPVAWPIIGADLIRPRAGAAFLHMPQEALLWYWLPVALTLILAAAGMLATCGRVGVPRTVRVVAWAFLLWVLLVWQWTGARALGVLSETVDFG